jgi:hypothetical protein
VESLDLGDWDKDDNSLLSTLDVKLRLELWDILLEVEESLSDLLLNLGGRGLGCVGGSEDLGLVGHDGWLDGEKGLCPQGYNF